jgi:hypothetical protein
MADSPNSTAWVFPPTRAGAGLKMVLAVKVPVPIQPLTQGEYNRLLQARINDLGEQYGQGATALVEEELEGSLVPSIGLSGSAPVGEALFGNDLMHERLSLAQVYPKREMWLPRRVPPSWVPDLEEMSLEDWVQQASLLRVWGRVDWQQVEGPLD